ncbi:MAG: DUF2917 domain-containing protein [Burkholderiaceae bacterium]
MLLTARRAQLNLADDEVARLRDASGHRLEVVDGFAWITIDGDRVDVVLGAGQSWVAGSAGVVTISALRGPAAVRVHADAGASPGGGVGAAARPGRLRRMMTRMSLSSVALA